MKHLLAVLIPGLLASAVPVAAPSTYRDGLYGFTIQAPVFPAVAEGTGVMPVMFMGPGSDGFASNINVGVQKTTTTLDAYVALSKTQFEAAGFKVNSEARSKVSGREAVVFDYQGKAQGLELRWLALAVVDKDRVFLVTATATPDGFGKIEKEFRACLESFRIGE